MEIIELKHVIVEDIDEKELERLNLIPYNMTQSQREAAWRKKISGSKVKSILSKPLSLLAYYMGWLTEAELDADLRHIPRINFFRDWGTDMEGMILNAFNRAVANEWVGDSKATVFRDTLSDSEMVYDIRSEFAPAADEKTFFKLDKRSFLLNLGGEQSEDINKASNLFMANIDGYATNEDGSIKYILEIKSKTGKIGEDGFESADIYNLHIDQIAFYTHVFKPTHGAVLAVLHETRGLKIHRFKPHELKAHWDRIKVKLFDFYSVYNYISQPSFDEEKALELLSKLNWSEKGKEVIGKSAIIQQIRRKAGGRYAS